MVQFNTPSEQDSEPIHYLVEWTEPALIEADAAYLRFPQYAGPENVILWYEGLFVAGETLSSFPRANPIAPENEQYNVEVRRLLYYGPSKRRGSQVYRLLFHIIEPQEDETEGVVRIMHVWHGAKGPSTQSRFCLFDVVIRVYLSAVFADIRHHCIQHGIVLECPNDRVVVAWRWEVLRCGVLFVSARSCMTKFCLT